MNYVFLSIVDAIAQENIGCCIVQVEDICDARDKCEALGLLPKTPIDVQAYLLDEKNFKKQRMQLDRLYTHKEMIRKRFRTSDEFPAK